MKSPIPSEAYGLIYCFVNLLDGRMYVGKTTVRGRLQSFFDGKYLGSSPSYTRYMRARARDGDENFIGLILEWIWGDKHALNAAERRWIAKFREERGRDMVYNLTDGGDGRSNFKWSDEERAKISVGLYRRAKNDPEFGPKRAKGMKNFWSDPQRRATRIINQAAGQTHDVRIAKSKKGKRSFEGNYRFLDPAGQLHEFTCLSIFCREHGLNVSSMCQVFKGHYEHHQGWKAA